MQEAFDYIEGESGKHFDPNIVATTVAIRNTLEKIFESQGAQIH